MGKAIDITGQRFGRLIAICDLGSSGSARVWQFKCDCGEIIARKAAIVRYGSTTSCGCFQRESSSHRNSADVGGERFGRLTAVFRIGPDKHRHVQWRCTCDCGSDCTVTSVALRKGTRSCGCLQREAAAAVRRAAALPADVKRERTKESAARQRKRRKTNPLAVMQARLSRLHRHALSQVGAIKTSPTFEQLGYTVEEFVVHVERQFDKGMGWHNMREWQIDHILPIRDAKDVSDVIALNQLSNLRPMWADQNNAKKARRTSLL